MVSKKLGVVKHHETWLKIVDFLLWNPYEIMVDNLGIGWNWYEYIEYELMMFCW